MASQQQLALVAAVLFASAVPLLGEPMTCDLTEEGPEACLSLLQRDVHLKPRHEKQRDELMAKEASSDSAPVMNEHAITATTHEKPAASQSKETTESMLMIAAMPSFTETEKLEFARCAPFGGCGECLNNGCSFCRTQGRCVPANQPVCRACEEHVGGLGCLTECEAPAVASLSETSAEVAHDHGEAQSDEVDSVVLVQEFEFDRCKMFDRACGSCLDEGCSYCTSSRKCVPAEAAVCDSCDDHVSGMGCMEKCPDEPPLVLTESMALPQTTEHAK